MNKFLAIALLLISVSINAVANFNGMLQAAKSGDATARFMVAYSYYLGEYRDGTKVEKDINKAYAWASLANYQGNTEAAKLINSIIPILGDREAANILAGEYFKQYGVSQ